MYDIPLPRLEQFDITGFKFYPPRVAIQISRRDKRKINQIIPYLQCTLMKNLFIYQLPSQEAITNLKLTINNLSNSQIFQY